MAKKSFLREVFKFQNLVTWLKAMILGLVFGFVYLLFAALVGVVGNFGATAASVATIVFILLVLSGGFIYGYLATRIWGWK